MVFLWFSYGFPMVFLWIMTPGWWTDPFGPSCTVTEAPMTCCTSERKRLASTEENPSVWESKQIPKQNGYMGMYCIHIYTYIYIYLVVYIHILYIQMKRDWWPSAIHVVPNATYLANVTGGQRMKSEPDAQRWNDGERRIKRGIHQTTKISNVSYVPSGSQTWLAGKWTTYQYFPMY